MPKRVDYSFMIGQTFGSLTVKSVIAHGRTQVECVCRCGDSYVYETYRVLHGRRKQCDNCKRTQLIGQRFGRLIVIECAGQLCARKDYWWKCQCDCGNTKNVATCHLTRGTVRSCGCKIHNQDKSVRYALNEAATRDIISNYKNNAKKKGREFSLSLDECKMLFSANCFYCGASPSNKCNLKHRNEIFLYNGIDRKDNTRGYVSDNVVSCCAICNYKKGDQHIDDFLCWIYQVAAHTRT